MNLGALFQNKVLIAGLIAWALAQIIKIPLDFLRTRRWNWALLLTTGGMPSSHSALMTAITLAIGLYHGFDHPTFALGVAITMIVTYDAARWDGEMLWMALYFSLAVWSSLALCVFYSLENQLPRYRTNAAITSHAPLAPPVQAAK